MFTPLALIASIVCSLSLPASSDADWQRIPSGIFEDCADDFEKAGFDPFEANRLAHIVVFGNDPVDLSGPESLSSGCSYYTITMWYCTGNDRKYERKNVGSVCVEAAIGLCVLPSCPSGQKNFFKLTTSAGCTPASTCVWISVSGPHQTDNPSVCNNLADCSCWPGLDCGDAVCVPVGGAYDHPIGCPSCS